MEARFFVGVEVHLLSTLCPDTFCQFVKREQDSIYGDCYSIKEAVELKQRPDGTFYLEPYK
jgi:hypothetical protein